MTSESRRFVKMREGFPSLDYHGLYATFDNTTPEQRRDSANAAVDDWLDALCDHLGQRYEIISSENFLVLSGRAADEGDLLVSAMERALKRITERLGDIAQRFSYPKFVAILFPDGDTFLNYISIFYSDAGEYGQPGGLYIREAFGHFILGPGTVPDLEGTITHELTHALLDRRHLPEWLEEALASDMELACGLRYPLLFTRAYIAEHRKFWGKAGLDDFWSGKSFHAIDEGQGLSYGLAEFLLNALPQERELLRQFIFKAMKAKDGGRAAAREVFGVDLEEFLAPLIGDNEGTQEVK